MRTSTIAVAALLVTSATEVRAAGGTLSDGATSLVYPVDHWSANAPAHWTGVQASPTDDVLYTSGWWYRVEGETREHPLPPPDSESYVGGGLRADWANLGGLGFQVIEEARLYDNEGPSGGLTTWMTVINQNGVDREFTLFYFVDVDVAGSYLNDLAQVATGSSGMSKVFFKLTDPTDASAIVRLKVMASGSGMSYQVASGSSLRVSLNDTSLTNLDGSGLPFGPGDFAAAFQRTSTIPPGNGASLRVSLSSRLPRDYVKGAFFDLPSYSDLWFQAADGSYLSQPMRRASFVPGIYGGYDFPPDTVPVADDDMDGDSFSDHVRRNPVTGAVTVAGLSISGATSPATNWVLASTGDFNADGKADILWRNQTSGQLSVWFMNGNARIGAVLPSPDHAADANWALAGTADFNNDGARDFLWYNQTSGNIVVWYMNAALQRITGAFTTPAAVGGSNWRVVAVADYGKGPGGIVNTPDIVWQNDTSHRLVVWYMNSAGVRTSGTFTTPDTLTDNGQVFGPR